MGCLLWVCAEGNGVLCIVDLSHRLRAMIAIDFTPHRCLILLTPEPLKTIAVALLRPFLTSAWSKSVSRESCGAPTSPQFCEKWESLLAVQPAECVVIGPVSWLTVLNREVVACTRCPRLVAYREQVARDKRRAYREWDSGENPSLALAIPKLACSSWDWRRERTAQPHRTPVHWRRLREIHVSGASRDGLR